MGRGDKKYTLSLHQQAYNKLNEMMAFGESKREAKNKDMEYDKIYSFNTYKTYWKHIKYFIKWIELNYQECTTLKAAKKHINEWLAYRRDQVDEKGEKIYSAWTIQIEAKALGKLYGIRPDDPNYFRPPKRERKEIKRSRVSVKRDKHFSVTNNDEFIKFCRGVGSRRNALARLKGEDLWSREEMIQEVKMYKNAVMSDVSIEDIKDMKDAIDVFPDEDYFIHFIKDKGGRGRFAPIIGPDKIKIVERMMNTRPGRKVWEHIPGNADIHSYRSDYAVSIYKKYARRIEEIPKDEKIIVKGKEVHSIYVCRKDEAKKKLDRVALIKCSKALGHNRESIVAENYLRGL